MVVSSIGTIVELFTYYLDFFKDWIIVLMVQAVLDTSNFASLESQIVFVMTLLLILPEIVKSIFLGSSFVQILELEGYKLNSVSKIIAKIFLTLSGPLLPSILLFKKGRKELSLLKKQNRLALDLKDMFQQSEDILKEEESELVMDSVNPTLKLGSYVLFSLNQYFQKL